MVKYLYGKISHHSQVFGFPSPIFTEFCRCFSWIAGQKMRREAVADFLAHPVESNPGWWNIFQLLSHSPTKIAAIYFCVESGSKTSITVHDLCTIISLWDALTHLPCVPWYLIDSKRSKICNESMNVQCEVSLNQSTWTGPSKWSCFFVLISNLPLKRCQKLGGDIYDTVDRGDMEEVEVEVEVEEVGLAWENAWRNRWWW